MDLLDPHNSDCGFSTDCPKLYELDDVIQSAKLHDVFDPHIRTICQKLHHLAQLACRNSSSVTSTGGWCLTPGKMHTLWDGKTSYVVPAEHAAADDYVGIFTSHIV